MTLLEYFGKLGLIGRLRCYIREGYVDMRVHKTLPLIILTYSRKTVIEDMWDEVTEKCRGLIVACDVNLYGLEYANIVSRPFEKFFNLNTSTRAETWVDNLPESSPVVTEKLDGSIGILYRWEGKEYIASKGSFHSDHAEWATNWYNNNAIFPVWPVGYTPVFEMICQDVQHHVVHYDKSEEGLYLLALINMQTGEELPYESLQVWAKSNGLRVPKILNRSVLQCILDASTTSAEEEGYVLSWPVINDVPLRVKVKFDDFLRLQKLMHGTTPKVILQMLREKRDIDALIANTPKEFCIFVDDWKIYLKKKFDEIMMICADIYNSAIWGVGETKTRKQYAEQFTNPANKRYSAILFAMLDQDVERIEEAAWKLVEPLVKGAQPMVTEE